jgi:hypothetical protein
LELALRSPVSDGDVSVSLEQLCEHGFRYRGHLRGLDPPTESPADGDADAFLDSIVVWRDGDVWCAL